MNINFDSTIPIFIQIAEEIEDMILEGKIKEHEQVPSTNELASFYKLNPATTRKGLNRLVADDLVYKKRGVGIFVKPGAMENIRNKRRIGFVDNYIMSMLYECKKLDLSVDEIIQMIKENEGRVKP